MKNNSGLLLVALAMVEAGCVWWPKYFAPASILLFAYVMHAMRSEWDAVGLFFISFTLAAALFYGYRHAEDRLLLLASQAHRASINCDQVDNWELKLAEIDLGIVKTNSKLTRPSETDIHRCSERKENDIFNSFLAQMHNN